MFDWPLNRPLILVPASHFLLTQKQYIEMFLKICALKNSQNPQGHTCARFFFSIKLQAFSFQLITLLKRDSSTDILQLIYRNFQKHYFDITPAGDCSCWCDKTPAEIIKERPQKIWIWINLMIQKSYIRFT